MKRTLSTAKLDDFCRAQDAAEQVALFAGAGKPRRKRGIAVERARAEVEQFIEAGDYASMRPVHFVALWMRCHDKVYGVVPAEMDAKAWRGATSAAEKLVRVEFGGDALAAVAFMRWVWKREKWREDKARAEGEMRVSRIGWRLQFVQRHLLTDYRLDCARRGSA